MPDRILREKYCSLQLLEQISEAADSLFWRLTANADDFGRFDARPRMIMIRCFPLRKSMNEERILELYHELERAGIVTSYVVDGEEFGCFNVWDQNRRAKHSKFPAPTHDNICKHASADASVFEFEVENRSRESKSSANANSSGARTQTVELVPKPIPETDPPGFVEFWDAWTSVAPDENREAARRAWHRLKPPLAPVLAALAWQLRLDRWTEDGGRFRPSAKAYVEDKRWQDRPPPKAPPKPQQESGTRAALRELAKEGYFGGNERGNRNGAGPSRHVLPSREADTGSPEALSGAPGGLAHGSALGRGRPRDS